MKTNKQGKVRIPKSGFKRSKFDWSHDVNTTFSWGEIQPTQCRMLVPGSKTTLHTQSLLRLAPMVAPTFGRVKYKTFNQFVSLEEIFPNFAPLMSAEPIKRLTGTKVPKFIPFVRLGALSSWVLQGCHGTLYKKEIDNDGNVRYETNFRAYANHGPDATWLTGIFNSVGSQFTVEDDPFRSNVTLLPDVGSRVVIRLKNFGDAYAKGLGYDSAGTDGPFDIITSMTNVYDMDPVLPENSVGTTTSTYVHDYQRQVTIEAADYVLEGTFNGFSFALAVELSDFGKRLRKVIQGAGYQIDFTSTANVSILPLFVFMFVFLLYVISSYSNEFYQLLCDSPTWGRPALSYVRKRMVVYVNVSIHFPCPIGVFLFILGNVAWCIVIDRAKMQPSIVAPFHSVLKFSTRS